MIELSAKKFWNTLYFIGTVVMLIWPAIKNGYPILFTDASTYIVSGYELHVPVDRPIVYGFFVWVFSSFWSLWFVIIAQSSIVGFFLFKIIKLVLNPHRPFLILFLISLLLSILTGISYFCSQISPDIFTFCGAVALLLVFLNEETRIIQKVFLALIILFSVTSHYSNIPILFGLFLILFLIAVIVQKRSVYSFIKGMAFPLTALILSIPLALTINYSLGAGFQLSRTSYVISGARFIESGLANTYLNRVCNENKRELPYEELCAYVNQFKKWPAAGFYLHSEDSPIYQGGCKEGGWENCWIAKNESYKALINDVLSEKDLRAEFIGLAITGSINQFFSFEHSKIDPFPFLHLIEKYFPNEIESFKNASQNQGPLYFYDKTFSEGILFLLSLLFVIYLVVFRWNTLDRRSQIYILFILSLLIINAVVCATLSNVVPRYQGRVVFLMSFSALLLLLKQVGLKYRNLKVTDFI